MPEDQPKKDIIITPLEKVVRKGRAEYLMGLSSPDGLTREEAEEVAGEITQAAGASEHKLIYVDPKGNSTRSKNTFGFPNWNGSAWKPEGIFNKPGSSSPSSLHPEQN